MSDQQTDLAQDLNFDDFNLSEAPQTDTTESQNRDSEIDTAYGTRP